MRRVTSYCKCQQGSPVKLEDTPHTHTHNISQVARLLMRQISTWNIVLLSWHNANCSHHFPLSLRDGINQSRHDMISASSVQLQ